MFDTAWIADLDATTACEAVQATQAALREAEFTELALAAHWADLHPGGESFDPHDPAPSTVGSTLAGLERSLAIGGDGTPEVTEFACAELGLLMGVGPVSAHTLVRDALDLRHRHPRLWALLQAGKGRVWKARQVAKLCHAAHLTWEQARFVDAVTTPYVDALAWSAFTRLVEAKIVEADPAAAEARRLAAELDRFVRTGRSSEHGIATLVARANAGEVVYFVAMCDRIAQCLQLDGDTDPVDVRRSKALAILAHPVRAHQLLARHASNEPHPDDPDRTPLDGLDQPADLGTIDPEKLRPRAVLHVRVSEEALSRGHGVAWVEGQGALTIQGLRSLLGHHHVSVRPVLDLRDQVPVEAYEVPAKMREALRLARPSSVFPWTRTDHPDLDHTKPYLPGAHEQTRTGNLGPLDRRAHRIKTHGQGWIHRQPAPGVYDWRTPHGSWFRVDHDGTHPFGTGPPPPVLELARDPVPITSMADCVHRYTLTT